MTAFSRPQEEGDAILGVRPGTVFEPSTVEEAVEVLAEPKRIWPNLAIEINAPEGEALMPSMVMVAWLVWRAA